MADVKSRVNQIANIIAGSMSSGKQDPNSIPWDPSNNVFPKFSELPKIQDAPEGSAWVWGKDDAKGRVNLITPARTKAASAEIMSGETIPLNLPLDEPSPPAFGRKPFEHTIKALASGAFDDEYSLNTQSSTQWDGFRHVAHPSGNFYNGTKQDTIQHSSTNDSTTSHPAGIQQISHHGISTRAFVVDYHTWAKDRPNAQVKPFQRDTISLKNLLACADSQGLNLAPASDGGDVRPGDILLIRMGFTEAYRSSSKEEWTKYATRGRSEQKWAGLDGGSTELREWIHDCYFAAVASDAPALEAWPPADMNAALHTSLLPLWGVLIGEFFDLERLAAACRKENRWKVFFTSSPPNVNGGVGAWANAMAIL